MTDQSGRTPSRSTTAKYATISDCGLYRYSLHRVWDQRSPVLPFVMLNPSTADAEVDDPTIRRCMGFAERDGFGGILVVNLFALRATKPEHLNHHPDPIGPEGDYWVLSTINACRVSGTPIVAAWGANPHAAVRGPGALSQDADWRHLGLTKQGAPRHPLYVKGDQPLVPFGGSHV
jgi:hypothetical protein